MSDVGTRAEHLAWAKARAIEYANRGDITGALASLASDLDKHSETANHRALELMMMLALGGHLSSPAQMREFIEGMN